MNKRQKEAQQAFLDNEKKVLKKLEENYQDAIFEINDKLERLLARQDADMQNVIYQVEYQKALKKQMQGILDQLHANEFETVSDYLASAYEDGFLGTMYDLQGQGIPLVIPIDQKQVAIAIQHETKLSEGLYEALGKDTSRLSKQIAAEISRGISNAATYGEMARNIASFSRIPMNNAARIARTEAHRIQNKATADAQWKAKEKGADVVKQWDASLDGKTRPHHRELDGQIRELDEPFEVGGMEAMYPGDFGDPAEDCNCRCCLLQRARWALGNDFTKWDQEEGGLVEIKAKDYADFKMKYAKESESVRLSAQKMSSDVGLIDRYKKAINTLQIQKQFTDGLKSVQNADVRTVLEHLFKNTKIKTSTSGRSFADGGVISIGSKATPGTVSHELFHVLFDEIKEEDSEFLKKELFSDYSKMYVDARMKGMTIEEYLESIHPEMFKNKEKHRVYEEYRGFSDILNGLSDGQINLGYGHREEGYWEGEYRLQSEAVAQYGRMFYESDEKVIQLLEELLPDSTGAMEKKVKEMADVLRQGNR